MTRVLFLTNVAPWPPYGGQYIRTYNQLDSLSRHFTVGALTPPFAEDCPLRARINDWYTLPGPNTRVSHLGLFWRQRSWAAAVAGALQRFEPDVVWFDAAFWGPYFYLARQTGTAVILGRHNVDPDVTRQRVRATRNRWRRWLGYGRVWAETWHEEHFTSRADLVIVVSALDQGYFQRIAPETTMTVLPNYVNEEWYLPSAEDKRDPVTVVMTGNFLSFQNKLGADWFLQDVWPIVLAQEPGACLQLVGQGALELTAAAGQRVTFFNDVPSVAPFLRGGTVSVVPLLHGSGTRYKILEAFACEIPVVSTTLGAAGIEAEPGNEILLADEPAGFAAAIVALLRAPEQRHHIAEHAQALLLAEYGFAVNTERLRRIIGHAAGRRGEGH